MESQSTVESFAALFLSVDYLHRATRLVTELCRRLPSTLAHANLSKVLGIRLVNSAAKFLHTFHSDQAAKWSMVKENSAIVAILNGLCVKMAAPLAEEKSLILLAELLSNGLKGSKTILSFQVVNMIFSVILRAIKNQLEGQGTDSFEEKITKIIVLKFLTSPAIILSLSNVTLTEMKSDKLLDFQKVILWLAHNRQLVSRLSTVENLNLLANFIHLSYFEQEVLIENLLDWTLVVNSFLTRCIQQLSPPNSCSSYSKGMTKNNNWHHPILGWISERIDEGTQGTFGRIRLQLGYLWSQRMVDCLFGKVLASFQNSAKTSRRKETTQDGDSLPVDLMQKLLKRLSIRDQTDNHHHPQASKPLPPVSVTALVCQLYQNALLTFSNTQIEILSGLCRNDTILLQLWNYVNEDANGCLPAHFAPLHLFADTAYSLISILDEKEMYESNVPFKLDQLQEIAKFANTFCFKVIWEKLIDLDERRPNALYQSIYQLCTILYNRDCRRSFTSNIPNFWTISDVKPTQFIEEHEKKTSRAQLLMSKMPHVGADHSTTVITVERSRIVEDGYRQLSSLPSQALRGTIRVKFINQQGLDEAGIDQDGVFKEFLELTLKKVFDSELNLFKSTSNSLLYPSSTSQSTKITWAFSNSLDGCWPKLFMRPILELTFAYNEEFWAKFGPLN
uniref:HECT-type E3 ubiquitin transferase n=1 Tax=Ditylenchus dipsaci TaxID=166011 RepID=A0A915DWR5_9BILA